MRHLLKFHILFRNRNFGLLYLGQFISVLGSQITAVAFPYQIYALTHSTLMVGLLSLAQLIPLLATALLGGVLADRYHRKYLLFAAETILSLAALILVINALQTHPSIFLIFLLAIIMSAVNGLHRPALDSMTQQIISSQEIHDVSVLLSFKGNLCAIGGPALGGLLIATFGVAFTYLIDALSFLFSLVVILMIGPLAKPLRGPDVSTWQFLRTGLRYAASRQELIGTYLVDFFAMIFGMPNALFPAYAKEHGGAKVLGLLYAAPALGALLISFFSGFTHYIVYHGRAIVLAAACWGVAMIGFGFAQSLWLALFCLLLAGAFDGISAIFRLTMWNSTIPNHLRGRLSGIEMISYLSGPKLGDLEAGVVAAFFGLNIAIISGGIFCVISVLGCALMLPKFWQYNTRKFKVSTS